MAYVKGTNGSDLLDWRDGVTDGYDLIEGYDGNDTIVALGGDDWISGGYGADTIYGGDGSDTASYGESATGVTVSLADGFGIGGSANGDFLFGIENLFGSDYDDALIGDDFANTLFGRSGRDILDGGGGADSLYGGQDDDTLFGGDGADTLVGDVGNDIMIGGAGDDRYYADGGDTITELAGEGYDVVFSTARASFLTDNVETLALTGRDSIYGTGNAQANTIFGNVNDNILEGGGGADAFNALGGNDNFVFRPGDANGDVIHEFAGNGAGVGDFMYFIGYGTIAQGATFHQLTASTWQINSADGLTHDVITLAGGPAIDAGDFVFI